MAKIKNSFNPKIWSEESLIHFREEIRINSRSYGTRLLRAAAKGEDWTKIKQEENIHDRYTNDAADALAYQLDANVLNSLRNRK
jgi:hypothetical protein